jgi:ubiquinone biosynthesis protein Coq4
MEFSSQLIDNFLEVVKDPDRTDLIFKVITAPEILNQKNLDVFTNKILSDPKGALLLTERYHKEWRLNDLIELPKSSIGYIYAKHMMDLNLDVDFYPPAPGEAEIAYLQTRMRRTHDIWHTITGFDTSVAGEIGLQAFTQAHMGIRSPAAISSMFLMHGLIFKPEIVGDIFAEIARGYNMGRDCKPLYGEKFEEFWDRDLNEYRQELGIAKYFV